MIKGSFEGVSMADVVGYKIAANWTPIVGFQGYFYIYVWDMNEPGSPFEQAVDTGEKGKPKRGTLILDGGERTYTFNQIDLISAQVGANRRNRYRLLEFRYDKAVTANGDTPVTISNKGKDTLVEGGLATDFQYSLDDGAEHLFGYRTRLAATGDNVVRFSTLRNNQNCFLQKMIKANNEKNQNTRMSDFTVTFSQQNYDVTQENLSTWYVDEAYGYLQGEEQPPLLDLVSGDDPAIIRQAVSLKLDDFTQRDLLQFDKKLDPNPRELESRTVETSTFVFKQGNYQNTKIK